MNRPPVSLDVKSIADQTIAYYAYDAGGFWEGTKDHDVSQNIAALLGAIDAPAPCRILDLGCGPGRDLRTFKQKGHEAIGLDGTPHFVRMAREYSGCEVWQQDLFCLDLPEASFDGVFANAVLFHIPSCVLPDVLAALHRTLKTGGVLFCSNPRGHNEEGWSRGRYGVFHDLAGWRAFLARAGFQEIDHYYRPAGHPREQQPWLASVWRK